MTLTRRKFFGILAAAVAWRPSPKPWSFSYDIGRNLDRGMTARIRITREVIEASKFTTPGAFTQAAAREYDAMIRDVRRRDVTKRARQGRAILAR